MARNIFGEDTWSDLVIEVAFALGDTGLFLELEKRLSAKTSGTAFSSLEAKKLLAKIGIDDEKYSPEAADKLARIANGELELLGIKGEALARLKSEFRPEASTRRDLARLSGSKASSVQQILMEDAGKSILSRLANLGIKASEAKALLKSPKIRGFLQETPEERDENGKVTKRASSRWENDIVAMAFDQYVRGKASSYFPIPKSRYGEKVSASDIEKRNKEVEKIQSILGGLGFSVPVSIGKDGKITTAITSKAAKRIRDLYTSSKPVDRQTAAFLASVIFYDAASSSGDAAKPRTPAQMQKLKSLQGDYERLVRLISEAEGETLEARIRNSGVYEKFDSLRGYGRSRFALIVPEERGGAEESIKALAAGMAEFSDLITALEATITKGSLQKAAKAAVKRHKERQAQKVEADSRKAAAKARREDRQKERIRKSKLRSDAIKKAEEISRSIPLIESIGEKHVLAAVYTSHERRIKAILSALSETKETHDSKSIQKVNTIENPAKRKALAREAAQLLSEIETIAKVREVLKGVSNPPPSLLVPGLTKAKLEKIQRDGLRASNPDTGSVKIPSKLEKELQSRVEKILGQSTMGKVVSDLIIGGARTVALGGSQEEFDRDVALLARAAIEERKGILALKARIKAELPKEQKANAIKIIDQKLSEIGTGKIGALKVFQDFAKHYIKTAIAEYSSIKNANEKLNFIAKFASTLKVFAHAERTVIAKAYGLRSASDVSNKQYELYTKIFPYGATGIFGSGSDLYQAVHLRRDGAVDERSFVRGALTPLVTESIRILESTESEDKALRHLAPLIGMDFDSMLRAAVSNSPVVTPSESTVSPEELSARISAERLAKQERAKKLIQEILSGDKAAFNDPAKMLELVGYIAGGRGKGAVATNVIAQALAEISKGGKLGATADQISKIASLFKISAEGKIEGPGGAKLLGAGVESADLVRQLIKALDPKFQDKEGTKYGKVLAESLEKALMGDKGLFGKVFGKKAQADLAKAAEETKASIEAADARRAKREAGGPVTRTRAAKGKLGDLKRVVDADGNESFVDAKGLPLGFKGKGFKHQGQVPAGVVGLGKYLVKQGLIAKPGDLETIKGPRGAKPLIDLEKTRFVSETARQIAGIVQDVRAKAMGIDPKSGSKIGKLAAGSLQDLVRGKGFEIGAAGKKARADFNKAVADAMADPQIVRKFSKGGVKQTETAPEFAARIRKEYSDKGKTLTERSLASQFLKKFGEAAAEGVSRRLGVPVGSGNQAIVSRLMQGRESVETMAGLRSRLGARRTALQDQLIGLRKVPARFGGQQIKYDQTFGSIPIYARSTRSRQEWSAMRGATPVAAAPAGGGGGGGAPIVMGGAPIVMPNIDLSGLKQIVADMNLIATAANSIPQIKAGARLSSQLNTIADTLTAVSKVQGTPSIKNIRAIGKLFDPASKDSISSMANNMGKTDGVTRMVDAAKGINRVLKAFDGLGAGVGTSPKDFTAKMANVQKIGNSIGKAFNGIIGSVQALDMGGISLITDQIKAIKPPKTGELEKVLQALAKVQAILDAAAGLKYGNIRGGQSAVAAARSAGAPGRMGPSITSGWKRKGREAFNPKYEKAEAAQIKQGQQALAEKVNSEYGKFISDALSNPDFARKISLVRNQKGSAQIRTNLQEAFESARGRIAAGRIGGAVKSAQARYDLTGEIAEGMKVGKGGQLAMRADAVRRVQTEASQEAMREVFRTFRAQLSRYVRPMFQGAVREFRDMARPLARAAAARTFSSASFQGEARRSQFPAPQNQQRQGFGGGRSGGGGGARGGGPRMPMGGGFPQDAAQPRFGTQGVSQFANDTMGILGNLAQQIRFGFTQEVTREIAQAFGRILAHLKDGIIQFNSVLETATVAFQTLFENEQKTTGTGFVNVEKAKEEAEKMVAAIQRFANVTPFRFPKLAESARRMRAFGFETREILPNMQAIGDAVAALGGEDDKIFRITYALGQMRQAGRVYQNDMMQLANAGIAGYDILSKALLQDFVKQGNLSLKYSGQVIDAESVQTEEGLNMLVRAVNAATDDATRGQVSIAKSSSAEIKAIFERVSKDPIEAIRDLTQSGKIGGVEASQAIIDGLTQEYGGGMKKLAKTFEGAFSTLADVSQYFVARLTQPIYNAIRDIIIDIGLLLQSSHATKIVENIAMGFRSILPRIRSSIFAIYNIFVRTFTGMGDFFNGAIARISRGLGMGNDALSMLSRGLNAISELLEYKVISAFAGAAVAAKAMTMALNLNPMLALITAIVFASGELQRTIFSLSPFGAILRGHLGTIESIAKSLANTIAPIIQKIIGGLSGTFFTSFLFTISLALPILEKILLVFNSILTIMNSIPFLPDIMGLVLGFALIKKIMAPLGRLAIGTKAGIDARGNPTAATGGALSGLDKTFRFLAQKISPVTGYLRSPGPEFTKFVKTPGQKGYKLGYEKFRIPGPTLGGLARTGASASQMELARSLRQSYMREAFNALPQENRLDLFRKQLRAGLGARASAAAISGSGGNVPLRGALSMSRMDSLAQSMRMLSDALKQRAGQAGNLLGNFIARRMSFVPRNFIQESTELAKTPGTGGVSGMGGARGAASKALLGGRIFLGNRGLIARSEINRVMKAISTQMSRKLYDFQSLLIKGLAKYIDLTGGNFLRFLDKSKAFIKSTFTINNLIKASEKFANGVIKMHKPLIVLAENIQSIPGRFSAMVASMKGFGTRLIDKAADAYIKGMYKLFMWPYSFQDAMSRGAAKLSSIFTTNNLFKVSEKFANAVVSMHKPFLRASNSLFFSGKTIRAMLATSTMFSNALIAMHKPLIRMGEIIAKYSSVAAVRSRLGELAASGMNKVMTAPIYGLNAAYRIKEKVTGVAGQIRGQTAVLFARAVELFKNSVFSFRNAAARIASRAGSAVASGARNAAGALAAAGIGGLALAKRGATAVKGMTIDKVAATFTKLGGTVGIATKMFGLLLKFLGPVIVLLNGLTRVSQGEDAGRVAVEEGAGFIGSIAGYAGGGMVGKMIGGTLGSLAGPLGSFAGMMIGGALGQLAGGFLADVMGMPSSEPTEAEQERTEKQKIIDLVTQDQVVTIGEALNMLESFYWEPIELVSLGEKEFSDLRAYLEAVKVGFTGVLPTLDQVKGALTAGLSGAALESDVVKNLGDTQSGSIGAILKKMTEYYAALYKGTANAMKAPAIALTDLIQRLLGIGPVKTVEDLQSALGGLANEWGANIDEVKEYGLYIGAATDETSKLSSAVDKLKSAFQRWSSRLQARVQMLFEKRLQEGLEAAKDKFDSTYNVIVDGIEMSVKALKDEIEAQEKKNKLLAIEKRIREATRNVEMARLAQYDASIDPLEAAARMREAEEAKTEALREAALERKKITLEEALESKPYQEGIKDIEELFESARLKFSEGMEDIMRQVEAGKLTAQEAVKKIEELYGVTLAEVGVLDANLTEDAKNFGDSFLNTWDTTLKKFINIVKKLKNAIKALKAELKKSEEPEVNPTKPVDDPTQWRRGVDTSITERMFNENSAATDFAAFLAARMQAIKETTKEAMANNIKSIIQNLSTAQGVLVGRPNPFATSDPRWFSFADAKGRATSAFLPGGVVDKILTKVKSSKTVAEAQGFAKVIYSTLAGYFKNARAWSSYAGGSYGGGWAGTIDLSAQYPLKGWGMASGGTIMGPGMFTVGEAGRETLQVVPGGVARVFPRRIRPISGIGAAGSNGGGINASVIINNPTVRNDQDIRKLAEEVSRAQRSLLRSSGVGRI